MQHSLLNTASIIILKQKELEKAGLSKAYQMSMPSYTIISN